MPDFLESAISVLVVLAIVGVWSWQYLRTHWRREVAALYFLCPYCRTKVEPGKYIAEGSLGWGHWTCVD